ncbi:MAG TPA: hypothetical protein VJ991_05035 [Balneolales bacterium]|nr:hypothetical protein [Balneolales bacterium]
MQHAELKKINVVATFASFRTAKIKRRITPLKMMFESGEVLDISQIRRTYTDKVGDTTHIHFVIQSHDGRFFDIVYDSKKMLWMMVVELEENLLFNN